MRFLLAALLLAAPQDPPRKPNLIFILADDLAQGDLGCFGQTKIKTPHLDRLAAEGTRFPQLYSGTSVCAPSRASLMLGLHTGHSPIRANREIAKGEGQMPIPADTPTVAEVLKSAGYATACAGKWGMGMFGTSGDPLRRGFDRFLGYNCQRHAHSYFPTYLYENERKILLDGKTYAQDLIQKGVEEWVRGNAAKPFFLFYAVTLPHGRYEIDSLGEYEQTDWTPAQKTYAAMVSRLDRDVGRLLALLRELRIDQQTMICFAGDNGAALAPDSPVGRFFLANSLRGIKRSLYEGGLRQCGIVRWPGKVPAGRVSEEPWAFWDFLPTAAEIAGARLPEGMKTDGLSVLPLLLGGKAPAREAFYWELHEGAFQQAVRFGDWKAVRRGPDGKIELYNLASDPSESKDLAAERPEALAKASALLESSRTEDPAWPRRKPPK
jgi:arylsulfatase A-like enzyme